MGVHMGLPAIECHGEQGKPQLPRPSSRSREPKSVEMDLLFNKLVG